MTVATVAKLIDMARADGLELFSNGDGVKLRGEPETVARWKPILAPHKADILTALSANDSPIPADLALLIQRAATFYGYSPEDLAEVEDLARRAPDGLRMALRADPLAPYMQSQTTSPDWTRGFDE